MIDTTIFNVKRTKVSKTEKSGLRKSPYWLRRIEIIEEDETKMVITLFSKSKSGLTIKPINFEELI